MDADLGRRRHHRHLRRDAVRRLEGALPLQGQVPRDGVGRRRHDLQGRQERPRHLPPHGPRAGLRLREGARHQQAGGAVDPALELRARDGRPALLPADDVRPRALGQRLHPRRVQDAADLQLVLREHERVAFITSGRLPAAPEGRQPRPAGQRRRASTSGRATWPTRPHPQVINPSDRLHRQLEQQAGQGLPGRPTAAGTSSRCSATTAAHRRARRASPSRRWPPSWPRPTPPRPRTCASSSCGRR